MKPPPRDWPRLSSSVFYQDAQAAIDWLCQAFGFAVRLKVEGEGGRIEHSELTYGEGADHGGPGRRQQCRASLESPHAQSTLRRRGEHPVPDALRRRCRRALRVRAPAWRADRRRAGDARLRRRLLDGPQLRRARPGGTSLVDHAARPRPGRRACRARADRIQPMTSRGAASLDANSSRSRTRRAARVIEALRRGELRAGELAAVVDMTPPALSRHLRVLRARRTRRCRSRFQRRRARAALSSRERHVWPRACAWLDDVEEFWSDQLQAFKAHAEGGARGRRGR